MKTFTCPSCPRGFVTVHDFDAHISPAYAVPARLRSKTCHCGRRYRPAKGETCSLCHYAPLTTPEIHSLPRVAKVAIADVRNGRTTVYTEGILAEYGLIIRDDYRDVGKAADVWVNGRSVSVFPCKTAGHETQKNALAA